jgi:hypothetical protein
VVVDGRLCRLADRLGLNCMPDGGRVPPPSLGAEPQDVAGIPVPRPVCSAGVVAGHESPGSVSSRNDKRVLFSQGGAE